MGNWHSCTARKMQVKRNTILSFIRQNELVMELQPLLELVQLNVTGLPHARFTRHEKQLQYFILSNFLPRRCRSSGWKPVADYVLTRNEKAALKEIAQKLVRNGKFFLGSKSHVRNLLGRHGKTKGLGGNSFFRQTPWDFGDSWTTGKEYDINDSMLVVNWPYVTHVGVENERNLCGSHTKNVEREKDILLYVTIAACLACNNRQTKTFGYQRTAIALTQLLRMI